MIRSAGKRSPRRTLIAILLCVNVVAVSICIYRKLNAPPAYQPKYQTIAHRFLALESKYDTIPEGAYELLDDVITTVKSRIQYDPTLGAPAQARRHLLAIFQIIDGVLIEKN